MTDVPLPTEFLMQRVGWLGAENPAAEYERRGRLTRQTILGALPPEWDWHGKRVLDFGCGAGRALRQFLDEAAVAEFYGCDLDEASIAWLDEHLSPPFRVFVTGEEPALPQEDGFFDLIWAWSVFTHLTDHWAGWLLELRRVLRPDGVLIVSTVTDYATKAFDLGPFDPDATGMNVIAKWSTWNDGGGPVVTHSEWWIREHWGRAFEIVSYEPPGEDQGRVVMRALDNDVTAADLERPSGDPRELAALQRNIEHLHLESGRWHEHATNLAGAHERLAAENAELRTAYEGRLEEVAWLRHVVNEAEARADRAEDAVRRVAESRSWRLTAPLRRLAGIVRRS